MKFASWPQFWILVGGLFIILLLLIIPYTSYNVYYAPEESPVEGALPILMVTCPAPVDQPSCDEFTSPVKADICEDCNRFASNKMTWFWTLFGLTIAGGIGLYVYVGYLQAQKE